MKKLTIVLIIASLILATGALAKGVYQIFNEDSYVYKNCYDKPSDGEKKCVIQEEDKFEGNPYKTCELNYEQYVNASLLSFGYKYVILSFTDGGGNKIATVDLKNCNVKEVILDLDIRKIRQIVFHDGKYHVIFYGAEVCKEYYCKAVYDSNGKIVEGKEVTPFSDVLATSDIRFQIAEKGLLMNEYRFDGQVKLYFISFMDFLDPGSKVLFSVPHSSWYGTSTLENKLGFCAFDDGKTVTNSSKKIICQQYDADGKTKIMESEIQIDQQNHVESLKASNVDKGMFVLVNEWQRNNDGPVKHTFIVYIDEHGKHGERYEIDVKCEKAELDLNFRKSQVYWVSYTCFDPFKPTERSRNSKCLAQDCYPLSKKNEATTARGIMLQKLQKLQ